MATPTSEIAEFSGAVAVVSVALSATNFPFTFAWVTPLVRRGLRRR